VTLETFIVLVAKDLYYERVGIAKLGGRETERIALHSLFVHNRWETGDTAPEIEMYFGKLIPVGVGIHRQIIIG
jgi:hypothetical protein